MSIKSKIVAVVLGVALYYGGKAIISPSVPKERYVKVVNDVLPKTVTITVEGTMLAPGTTDCYIHVGILGSGVFITSNGHILSCAHLFDTEVKIDTITVITAGGTKVPATLLFKDEKRDLSLLRVNLLDHEYADLADPRDLQVGQEVIAVGTPLTLAGTVTTGIISALHRDSFHYDMVQMSAPINPGNSGGPLFNLSGQVVGINILILSANDFFPTWSGIGFSVSSSEINIFLANFRGLEKTFPKRHWRGL